MYNKDTQTHMTNERKPRKTRQLTYGADKAGPIKVIKADGSVEVKPPMTREELRDFLLKYE